MADADASVIGPALGPESVHHLERPGNRFGGPAPAGRGGRASPMAGAASAAAARQLGAHERGAGGQGAPGVTSVDPVARAREASREPIPMSPRGPEGARAVPPPAARRAKRALDLALAGTLLVLLAPLFLALAALVRRDGGPAFYAHPRLGAGGQAFRCLKFRSMVTNSDARLTHLLRTSPAAAAEWAATQKLRHDPRITPLGRFLRRTSLDELPQLLNVLRGEMSLVGPRPIVAPEAAHYGDNIAFYVQARPGLTGLWQISGRSDTSYSQRVQLDTRYVQTWSLAGDLAILAKTIPAVLSRKGAV